VVVHSCNHNYFEAEVGGFLSSKPSLVYMAKSHLKKKKKKRRGKARKGEKDGS
jgi:hypothetical protein